MPALLTYAYVSRMCSHLQGSDAVTRFHYRGAIMCCQYSYQRPGRQSTCVFAVCMLEYNRGRFVVGVDINLALALLYGHALSTRTYFADFQSHLCP